ncbi:acyl-CoA dehydrogenase family protein [Oceanobacillus saliphilus]|uniref:acyl-CoA dehydrogenase family protein n=1 Tax=Oceanobacillus saliphilus TaxID=2925834 RepID=UPI00201D934A|nr:acyl-CoA dehydrogenase family protein [Oceanobacillus saliphilus]
MNFDYTNDEKILQASVNRMFKEYVSIDKVRGFLENGNLPDSLIEILSSQGLLSTISWEEKSESIEGITYAVLTSIEAGRVLLPFPLLENSVASYILQKYGSNSIYEEILTCEELCTIAWESYNGSMRKSHEGFQLTGKYSFVPFAENVNYMLTKVELEGNNDAIAIVNLSDDSVSVKKRNSIDETYPLYDVILSEYNVTTENLLINNDEESSIHKDIETLGRILICAEMVGLSEEILNKTVAYSNERKQFNQSISKFQALKHMAAESYLLLEGSKAALDYATAVIDSNEDEDIVKITSIVKSYVSDASNEITGTAIQMHGGIGYTWESDVHLYFKRSRRSATMLGDVYFHRELISRLLLDEKVKVSI